MNNRNAVVALNRNNYIVMSKSTVQLLFASPTLILTASNSSHRR